MPTNVDLAQNLFYLHGGPLNMPEGSMRHLWPIYNRKDNAILLKFGRQTHKSTTIGFKLVLPCVKFPNYHDLYVAPTGNQVSVFSTDKLNGAYYNSPVIKRHYISTRTKSQVFYKEYNNGSKTYLRSAFHSADSIRGISADMTTLDEIQDILSDHIPVIEQCMSHSLAKWEEMSKHIPNLPMNAFNAKIYSGTPKTIENTLERYWDKSTQNEWIIKCLHCNKYNYINEDNVGPTCLICNKCERPIYYENGSWITMNPDGFIQGYRLPQIILNWVNNRNNPEAWNINVIQTRDTYSTEKFYNEVLALPYANAKNPLSPADIMVACKDYSMVVEPDDPIIEGHLLFAGIDWGKGDTASGTSYTVLTIGGVIRGRFKTLLVKKYKGKMSEATAQIDDILQTIRKFKVRFTLADFGDGRTSNAILTKALGVPHFAEVYEHLSLKGKLKWDKRKGLYIINRTDMMTDIFMEIKDDKVDFFKYEEFKEYSLDFLSIYADYSEITRMTRYDHTNPDDCFHSYMFCRLACMIARGELNKYIGAGGMFHEEEPTSYTVGG